jgi:hypothetical protein
MQAERGKVKRKALFSVIYQKKRLPRLAAQQENGEVLLGPESEQTSVTVHQSIHANWHQETIIYALLTLRSCADVTK